MVLLFLLFRVGIDSIGERVCRRRRRRRLLVY